MNDNGNGNAVGGELEKVSTTKKMSSHENEEDAPSSEEVQPSSMLIDILHHKLRDPSIVRKFEDSRQDSSTYGLVCPRWVLQHAKSDVVNDDINESKLDVNNIKQPNRNRESRYNSYPKRNYIDLRMEQNRMFANEQCDQCKALLSKLSQPSTTSQSTPSSNNIDTNNNKQWKKQADTIQSLLNEGLASCPNHVGLLQAEKEYKEWIQQRINILSTPSLPTKQTAAAVDKTTPSISTLLPNSAYSLNAKKGAENRAQAALRDAQLERSFMFDGDTKDDKKDDNNNMYPLLSANDDDQHQDINGINKQENMPSGSDTDEDSRRRTKSKHKYKKHKRSKSRHGHDDRRRRRKRDRRSRSRSMSRSHSRSSSVASSQSSDSYRRRKHRRKEKKRRKKKERRRNRESRSSRYSSEEDNDDNNGVDTGEGSKDEKQVERSI